MTDISAVIGWKFNHQPGMSTKDGEIIEFPAEVPRVNYDESGLPTQEDQDAWTLEYEAHIAATQYITDRKVAMHDLLPESMCTPAMLEQARADREGGKTLEPGLEATVNIYAQILTDNQESS